jgi:hypothetical protein
VVVATKKTLRVTTSGTAPQHPQARGSSTVSKTRSTGRQFLTSSKKKKKTPEPTRDSRSTSQTTSQAVHRTQRDMQKILTQQQDQLDQQRIQIAELTQLGIGLTRGTLRPVIPPGVNIRTTSFLAEGAPPPPPPTPPTAPGIRTVRQPAAPTRRAGVGHPSRKPPSPAKGKKTPRTPKENEKP